MDNKQQIVDEKGRRFSCMAEADQYFGYLEGTIRKAFYKHHTPESLTVRGHLFTRVSRTETGTPSPKVAEQGSGLQTDTLIKKLQERYSREELEALAAGQGLQDKRLRYSVPHLTGKHHRIGVMSDGHLGSKYAPLEWHKLALEEFEKQGCECIVHCGDLVEGLKRNRADTQIYELSHIGYKAQRDLAVEVFSQTKLPIYAISGNHDDFFGDSGANIVEDVCSRVKNMTYLGDGQADMDIDGITLRLYHGGDGNCFTEGTEILTKNGWVDFKDLTLDMEVATMTKDGHRFEWQRPTEITNQPYSGKVYHFRNRKFDFTVTPNHRLWVKYNHNINRPLSHDNMPQKAHIKYDDNWHALTAEEIAKEWRKQKWVLPTTPNGFEQLNFDEYVDIPRLECKNKGMENKMYHAGRISIRDIAELIAWYVTEGHATEKAVNISQYKSVNAAEYEKIKSLANRLGCGYTANDKGITIHSKELSAYLRNTCGHGSRNKFIPGFIKDNSREIIELVLNTCVAGDGWKMGETGQLGYRSISKKLLSDVAEIALKLGYSVSFRNNGDSISLSKVQIEPSMVRRPEEEDYTGNIYCCSVPNELIYVRKNGRCFFSHNSYALSYRLQKLIESFSGGKKPNILLAGHVHKYVHIFERNIQAVSVPSLQMQTPWMQQRKLAAHSGFLIIDFDTFEGQVCNFSIKMYPFYE